MGNTLRLRDLGLSVCAVGDLTPGDVLALLGSYGLGVVEISEHYIRTFPDCVKVLKDGGATVTEHVPFAAQTHHPLSKDPAVRTVSIGNIEESMRKGRDLGVEYFTVHLMDPTPATLAEFWDDAVAAGRRIGHFAAGMGARVGFENCYRMVIDGPTAARFLAAVDCPAAGLTLDAGHFWSALDLNERGGLKEQRAFLKKPAGVVEMNRMLMEMVQCVRHRIFHVHLHDILADSWQDHRAVGSGVMDCRGLFARLAEMDWRGTMVVELRGAEAGEGLAGLRRSFDYIISTGLFATG
ncbi:MAG: sugar phosphate isomerase/epimerase family protein [Phycisphaerae bacterium]